MGEIVLQQTVRIGCPAIIPIYAGRKEEMIVHILILEASPRVIYIVTDLHGLLLKKQRAMSTQMPNGTTFFILQCTIIYILVDMLIPSLMIHSLWVMDKQCVDVLKI